MNQKDIINYMKIHILIALVFLFLTAQTKLIFSDDFDTFDFKKWKHDITLSGGGNWEFELYENNRSTSWVQDSKLNIRPVLTEY